MPGLEGNRLRQATIRQGYVTVIDDSGEERVRLGRVTIDSHDTYGVLVKDPTGATVLAADEFGLVYPAQQLPVRDATVFEATTAADLSSLYWASAPKITADALTASIPWTTDPATTGEIRLRAMTQPSNSGTFLGSTVAVALPAGTAGLAQQFNWLHGQALGSGPVYFNVQARRTSGVGNVNIYIPDYLALIGSSAVSATTLGA